MMIKIHKVGAAEENIVREIDALCLPDTYFEGMDKGNHHWLAEVFGIPVAFASIRETRTDKCCVFLSRSGVLPEARGQGLQKRLIQVRLNWAIRRGYKEVVSYVGHANSASIISLLKSGLVIYEPEYKWAGSGFLYFHGSLRP